MPRLWLVFSGPFDPKSDQQTNADPQEIAYEVIDVKASAYGQLKRFYYDRNNNGDC